MQSLFSFLARVGLVPPCFRVLVLFLVPLVVVEVIAHLTNSLSCWSLILHWNFRQSSVHVKFYIISLKKVLVFLIDFHILIALDAVIVFACDGVLISFFCFLQFFVEPIGTLLWVIDGSFILLLFVL